MENEGNLSFLIPIIMVKRFLSQTSFTTQEDFIKNFKINVPENFNFGYDVVDAWAAEQPDKPALLWTNDKGEHRQFTFADMKRYTDMTACGTGRPGMGGTRRGSQARSRCRTGCCCPRCLTGLRHISLQVPSETGGTSYYPLHEA